MVKKDKMIAIIVAVISMVLVVSSIIFFLNKPKENNITYNVIFDSNGGTEVQNQTINQGELIQKPEDPTKEGYIFVEWTYQGLTYDFSLEVTKELILVAKWVEVEEDVKSFVVKFETDGGTTISNQIIEKGNKIQKPIDPTKEGYKFLGWTLNGKDYDFNSIVEDEVLLKAKWEKIENVENNKPNNNSNNNNSTNSGSNNNNPTTPTVKIYKVTFDSKGGDVVASQTIEEGKKVIKPGNPTRSGYTFAGWTLNGEDYDFDSVVNSNITLAAKWTENPKVKYTVTFDSKGGSSVSSQTVEEGNKATNPKNPTRNGYTFAGWTLNGSNYDFNSSVKGNITLVAKWNQKSYTIKISAVDDQSPARVLSVYEDGVEITSKVKEIKYTNGTYLCSGSNPNINWNVVKGQTSFIIVLSDGTQMTARVS